MYNAQSMVNVQNILIEQIWHTVRHDLGVMCRMLLEVLGISPSQKNGLHFILLWKDPSCKRVNS